MNTAPAQVLYTDRDPRKDPILINADEGYVRLIDWMGDDHSIARAARGSTGSVARNEAEDARLIGFLMKNGHTSPFEHVTFTFHIRTLRAIFDEHVRHRTWSYNAESQRYKDMTGKLVGYIPPADKIGFQPPKGQNQQGRVFGDHPALNGQSYEEYALDTQEAIISSYTASFAVYEEMIKAGTPREVARLVLPMGLFMEYYATVDLWNLMHFFRLRCAPSAQWEIQEVANAMKALVAPLVPIALAAFERHVLKVEPPTP